MMGATTKTGKVGLCDTGLASEQVFIKIDSMGLGMILACKSWDACLQAILIELDSM